MNLALQVVLILVGFGFFWIGVRKIRVSLDILAPAPWALLGACFWVAAGVVGGQA